MEALQPYPETLAMQQKHLAVLAQLALYSTIRISSLVRIEQISGGEICIQKYIQT